MRGVGGDRVHGYDLDVQIVEGGEKSEKLRLIGHAAHQPSESVVAGVDREPVKGGHELRLMRPRTMTS